MSKPPITFNAYQHSASATRLPTASPEVVYPALGLAGEAGEVANKVKKLLRDAHGQKPLPFADQRHQPLFDAIADELGDCLWYLSELARDCGFTLEEIAERNLTKLSHRQHAGTLQGAGDQR